MLVKVLFKCVLYTLPVPSIPCVIQPLLTIVNNRFIATSLTHWEINSFKTLVRPLTIAIVNLILLNQQVNYKTQSSQKTCRIKKFLLKTKKMIF